MTRKGGHGPCHGGEVRLTACVNCACQLERVRADPPKQICGRSVVEARELCWTIAGSCSGNVACG